MAHSITLFLYGVPSLLTHTRQGEHTDQSHMLQSHAELYLENQTVGFTPSIPVEECPIGES